ncbi:1,4-dihydroxy-6-naphthoate synthase [Stieleria sp. TO1_6]|uniref:1,4-dihydroxy-6-naphthoate synthase n=1 Tax=Stieleria tagensis TaxID=2956795 RepID=UPI00209B6414|nr:1,4-dihydroxy-6-naphthoate synthase [Stieleria tagensis]MCO8122694.1 1,4-dihydroxy-6-naphthoate synthase [Stieleria tagensis]
MNHTIRLGISTCPNDTFTFHAILNRLVDWRGINFQIELLDIQQLNERLFADQFDVSKCSFHAALLRSDSTIVLPSGSALGFGVGPLLLSADPGALPPRSIDQVTLCPGEHTTASLLFRLFYPQTSAMRQVVFSEIMPGLRQRTADYGVCIHEGRFTWQDQGLGLVEDLGTRWERETHCPLPLGGLVGMKSVPREVLRTVQTVVRESLEYSLADPDRALPTMRQYAQEFNDDVLMQHVELYVNEWTIDLGAVGADALHHLNEKAKGADVIPRDAAGVEILPL